MERKFNAGFQENYRGYLTGVKPLSELMRSLLTVKNRELFIMGLLTELHRKIIIKLHFMYGFPCNYNSKRQRVV